MPAESLAIYECPTCGFKTMDALVARSRHLNPATAYACPWKLVEVRVFREEDVRPLWEAARESADDLEGYVLPPLIDALDAFPAPSEWKDVS